MGDSDDDYENRRSRDKFRRERQNKDYDMDRSRDKNDNDKSRNSWNDRSRSDNRRNQDDNRRSSRYSPNRTRDYSPPAMKRMRHDTWEDSPQNGDFIPAPMHPHHWQPPHPHDPMFHMGNMYNNQFVPNNNMQPQQQRPHQNHIEDNTSQTVIMTFKQFIINEPDDITDSTGVSKYQDYKNDVRSQQICEFFTQHKCEEWFRIKYHPDESLKRENELRIALQKRKDVFMELQNKGLMADMSFDLSKNVCLEKILNSAVVLMEGGDETDLDAIVDEHKEENIANESITQEPEKKDDLVEDSEMKDDKDEGIVTEDNDKDEEDDDGRLSDDDEDEEMVNSKPKESDKDDKKIDAEINNKAEKIIDPSISLLHKTQSIFLRNLSPLITKREVEAMCKKLNGYKRVAIQDPQSDRKFYRRGWITFESNVNIKEICFSLTKIRLRDCEMGAIINRDLKQRIRPVSGIVSHRSIAIQDLKNAIQIIKNYDNKWKIWNRQPLKKVKDGDDDLVEGELPYSNNDKDDEEEVILDEYVDKDAEKNYLVREAITHLKSLENVVLQEEEEDVMLNHDSDLIKLLDKLLMYLRIVYSFDYFAAIEYPNEDEMPHRCGIAHARAALPVNKLSKNDVSEWISAFELRIAPFINMTTKIPDSDATKLGKKYKKIEVEKFVEANTTEQSKDKWLCPLSGKKFKGSDFVRKHIFNKYADKVETVRNDVEFFNNFLYDINRPGLPEVAPQSGRTSTYRGNQANPTFNTRRTPQQMPQRNPIIRPFITPRGDMWRPRLDRRSDPRGVIAYHDLDAPTE